MFGLKNESKGKADNSTLTFASSE